MPNPTKPDKKPVDVMLRPMSGRLHIYTGNGWEIRCGRWQDSAPESVDVVISDPPFDDRTSLGARSAGRRTGETIASGVAKHERKRTVTSFMGIDPAMADRLIQISQRWVLCFCAVEQIAAYRDAAGDAWIRAGAWVKRNPTPQFTGDRPATWGEAVAIMHRKGRKRWNGGGYPAVWHYSTYHGHRVHETQKPLPLMLELVELFSEPGELVWDPYCGSGTTGVACLRLGRRFLGHEMQPHYAEIAAERLAAEERGLTLRDARAGQQSIFDIEDVG